MKNKKIINVLYQSNDAYAMVSGISILSLLENNKHLDEINIFYCDYEISKSNINRLQKMVGKYPNAMLEFIDAEPYHRTFEELGVEPWHGFYITWLKLLAFGDLKLKTDRVLFINGHTIINGALDELLDLDFGSAILALSYDCLINEHKKAIGLRETDGYFNCGIMLVNHKKWREERTTKFIKEHLREKSDYMIADQDLCNILFKGRIKLVGPEYNFSSAYYAYDIKELLTVNNLKPSYFYSYEQIMENYYSPKIIHSLFGIKGKPWEVGNDHPQRHLWDKYIRMSPWKNMSRPRAVRTRNWFLYDHLPNKLFMRLYQVAVRNKFAK